MVRCPVVRPAVRILHGVRKLVLDEVGPEAEHFAQDDRQEKTGTWASWMDVSGRC